MIHETKSLWQRITAVVLAVILAVGMTPAIIADTIKPTLNLVSLGDSMTNGYGHDGYEFSEGKNVNGFRQNDVETSYPAYLKAYLEAQGNDVNWEQLAISCMRPEDINFLLRFKTDDAAWRAAIGKLSKASNTGTDDWNTKVKDVWNSRFVDDDGNVIGDFFTWNEFVTNRFWDWTKKTGAVDDADYTWSSNPTLAYAKYYQNAIKNADVITLGVGNTNFGVIMLQSIIGAFNMTFGDYNYRYNAVSTEEFLTDRLDEDVLPFALLALEQAKKIAADTCADLGVDAELAEKLIHTMVYTTMSTLVNYWEMLCAIDKLNNKDNLDVIMVDLINAFDDCTVILPDGSTFDIGECINTLFDVISACIFAMPVIRQDVGNFENITFYAVPNDNAIEMLNADMSDFEKIADKDTVLRDRMIGSYVSTILPILGFVVNAEDGEGKVQQLSLPVDRAAVELYESIRGKLTAATPDYVGALESYNQLVAAIAAVVGNPEGKFAAALTSGKTLTIANDPGTVLTTPEMLGTAVVTATVGVIAAYVAFEKAIAANANNTTIDLRNLMPLFGDLDAAFEPLTDAVKNAKGPMSVKNAQFQKKVRKSVLIANGVAVETSNAAKNKIDLLKHYVDGKISQLVGESEVKTRLQDVSSLLAKVLTDTVIPTMSTGDTNIYGMAAAYSAFGDSSKWFTNASGKAWYDVDYTLDNGTNAWENNPFLLQMMALEDTLNKVYCEDNSDADKWKATSFAAILAPYYPDVNDFLPLINAPLGIEPALSGALTANNAKLGDLFNLFARMIVGNGMGSHPSVKGHQTIAANILKIYGNDIRAKELLRERVWNAEIEFCELVAEYGPEAFEEVLAYAVKEGYITAEQAAQFKAIATNLVNAINAGDAEAIAYNSAIIAGGVYMFALSEGWVPETVQKYVNYAIKLYHDAKDMNEDELEAYFYDLLKDMIDEHGIEVVHFVEAYIIDKGWLTAEQVALLNAQVKEIIANYKIDPEYAKKELVKDIVHWLYDIAVENKIIDPAVIDEITDELLELKKYITIMNTPVSDGPIENYVSLGASFANGYGLLGYYGNADLAKLALDSELKATANVLGYNLKPADSYPSLIAKALGLKDYDQLAISSMRVEEARILLEDGYNGDAYSAWRFLGEGKWFDIADGTKDGDFSELSNAYRNAVKSADLITLDLGVNNFAVYLSYQLTSGFSLDNDVALINPVVGAIYADMKAYVEKLVGDKYPELNAADYEQLIDTLAYALIGYCYNFDRVLDDIYTVNPDVQIVVVAIQNLLDGMKLDIGGTVIDLGYLAGALINVANTYMAVGSPYAAKYLVADVRKDGHVELNADVIARYNGNPSTLSAEMKACFDILDGNPDEDYDSNIHIQYIVHNYLAKNWKYILATAVDAQNYDFTTSTAIFDAYDGVGDSTTLDSFLAMDFSATADAKKKAVQNAVAAKCKFVLDTAYDVYATILAEGAKVDTLTLNALVGAKSFEDVLLKAFNDELMTAVVAALDDSTYSYAPSVDFSKKVATATGANEADVKAVLALAVRTTLGNSYFAHPSKDGHAEMAAVICKALAEKTTGKDVIASEIEFAANKLYETVVNFGIATFEEARQYVIDNGYATVEELAALSAIIDKMAAAIAANDEAALKAACNELAELAYVYADVRGYIPCEAKLVVWKVLSIYDFAKNTTIEEIKAQMAAQINKLIEEQTAAALIALRTYIAAEGWMTEEQMTALDQQVAAIIAAYEVDPEGTAKILVNELVAFLYAAAVEAGYIDPAVVADAFKLVTLISNIYDYFMNTPAEQIKADAINELFVMIDKLVPNYIDEKTAAQIKSDVLTLIYLTENYTTEELIEMAKAYVEEQKALYEFLLNLAMIGYYSPNEDSYYVALGGGTVYGLGIGRSDETYAEIVAKYYGVNGASFGKEILLPTELLNYVMANADELSKADLITYQLDASSFILAIMADEDRDWNNYFTDEQLAIINTTLDVIVEILNDDWNKYVDWDADEITATLKAALIAKLAEVHGAIYEKLAAGNQEIEAVYDACVKSLQWTANHLQEKATIAAETLISEIKWVDELFVKVEEELATTEFESIDWLCIKEGEAEAIIDAIAAKIFATEGAMDAKVQATIRQIVSEIVKLHAAVNAKLAAFDDRLNAKEHVMEAKLFNLIKECVVAEWPYFEGKTAADVHDDILNCVKAAVNAKKDEFESFINANVDDIDAIIEYYTAVAIEYVEYAFANINGAVGMLEAEHEEFKAMVKPYLDVVLLENWAAIVGQNADFVKQTIEAAVEEKLNTADATIRAYVDAHAEEFNAILSCMINEIQTVVGAVQAEKAKVADIVNGLAPLYDTIEQFLYTVVAYATETSKAIDAIREINPDATLVVVGMYNPLDGLMVEYNGETIDVGEYADYFVELTNAFYANLAIVKGNFTFVPVPETETNAFDVVINLNEVEINKIGATLVSLYSKMHADAVGQEYIAEQIINALIIIDSCDHIWQRYFNDEGHYDVCINCFEKTETQPHVYDDEHDLYCNECNYKRVIIGDFNEDGYVDKDDAIFLLNNTQYPEDPDYKLNQDADFDGDNKVTHKDAIYLLYNTLFGDEEYPLVEEDQVAD